MPTYGDVQLSWIHLHCQHRSQCNSLSAAWLIFISGGMKIAWSIYEQPLLKSNNSVFGEIHLIVSWFIGVIIGAILAAIFVHRLSKNVTHYTSGSLVIIGGILFVCIPNSFTAALVGRYLDGIAFGMTLLQAIVTGGEVPIRYLRGTVMSSERIFIWIGICAQLCYSIVFFDKTYNDSVIIDDDQIHGTVAVVLGVIALLCTAGFQIESPIYLHINQRESESISSIMRLQRRHHPTNEIFEIFDDNKLWIREKLTQSFKEEIQNGSTTFLKMAFLRVLVSLAMSLPFHWAYVMSITTFSDSNIFLLAYGIAGLMGSLISVLFMDCQGRRVTSMFSLCLGGIILLALSGIFLELEIHIDWTSEMRIVTILLVAYQAVNAFGFGPATTIYVSEAFAIPLKTWFITGIIAVENFVQVLTCVLALTVTVNYAVFFFTIGVLNCIAFLVVVFLLPETKELTLRQCSRQFSESVKI